MAGFKALSKGAKAALLAGGAVAVAVAGYGAWSLRNSPVTTVAAPADQVAPVAIAPKDPAPDVAQIAPEPATETAVAAPAAPEPIPDATAPAMPIVPSFDVVRVEPDGTTVVAGRADPGSKIVLRVDGAEITATTADENGNFAAFFILKSSKAPRLLTMTSILSDQSEVPSAAEVALAPTQAPVVAAAEPGIALSENAAPETTTAAPEPQVTALPEAPAALLITKDGAKVLQSAGQVAATDQGAGLSIDTISYTPEGDVQLAGHSAPAAVLRIYLDNAPLIDAKAGEDGLWATTMPPIAPGIYTLRADQLAADGSVTARFETPFKRETQDALVAAAQTPEPAVVVEKPEPDAAVAVAEVEPKAEATATPAPEPTAADDAAAPVVVAEATASPTATSPVSITVQPGFTLWGIASKQFGDGVMYVQVFEANKDKIRDPDLIYPGQVFVIPAASE